MKNLIIFGLVVIFYASVQTSASFFTISDLASVTHGGEIIKNIAAKH